MIEFVNDDKVCKITLTNKVVYYDKDNIVNIVMDTYYDDVLDDVTPVIKIYTKKKFFNCIPYKSLDLEIVSHKTLLTSEDKKVFCKVYSTLYEWWRFSKK